MIKSYTGDSPAPSAGKKRSTKGLLAGPAPNTRKLRSKKSASPSSSNTQTDSPPPSYNGAEDDLPGPDSPPLLVQANLPALMGSAYGGSGATPVTRSGSSRSSSPLEYQLSSVLPNEYPNAAPTYPAPLQYDGPSSQSYPTEAQDSAVYYDQDVPQVPSQQGELAGALHDVGSQQGYSQYEQHMDDAQSPHLYQGPSSRHSLSHIAPAESLTLPSNLLSAPPSPPSDSPHSSGPITPVYTYREDYPRGNGSYEDVSYYGAHNDSGVSASEYAPHLVSHVHDSFNHMGRYHQPSPPMVVPGQDRLSYSEYGSHHQSQSSQQQHHVQQQQQQGIPSLSSPYLHHPRPITSASQYNIPHLSIQPVDWSKAHSAALSAGVGSMH